MPRTWVGRVRVSVFRERTIARKADAGPKSQWHEGAGHMEAKGNLLAPGGGLADPAVFVEFGVER